MNLDKVICVEVMRYHNVQLYKIAQSVGLSLEVILGFKAQGMLKFWFIKGEPMIISALYKDVPYVSLEGIDKNGYGYMGYKMSNNVRKKVHKIKPMCFRDVMKDRSKNIEIENMIERYFDSILVPYNPEDKDARDYYMKYFNIRGTRMTKKTEKEHKFETMSIEDFITLEDVDSILDKISKKGIESLKPAELKILEEESKRF